MPNLTVTAAGVRASVQAYPQGRIGYLTVTCDADTVLTGVCNVGHHCCLCVLLLLQGCTKV